MSDDNNGVSITRQVPTFALVIHGSDGKMLVQILNDGHVEFGEHYSKDEAARLLWEAFAGYMQAPLSEVLDALEAMYKSARPHTVEHPTMTAAWARAAPILLKHGRKAD